MEIFAKAMEENDLHMHQEYFHGSVTFDQQPNSFQQVVYFAHLPFLSTVSKT